MEPFLSIIIPVYKIKEEYLRACLDSLEAQSMPGFQIIMVDDGSPDKCGGICDEYASGDKRIRVIHQKNAGVSVARNNGIKAADTEWITFVDPDDWVEPDYISILHEAISGNTADIYLFDYYQEFDSRQKVKHLMDCSGMLNKEWTHNLQAAPFNLMVVDDKPFEYETNTIWNKMYRASLIREHTLEFVPEAHKGQDVIFNAECLQLTDRFYYIRSALYHYRYLQESVTNRFNPRVMYYNEVAFKHYESIIKKYMLPEEFREACQARIVTRLYSCMRLYYFHEKNTVDTRTVNAELDAVLDRYPYNEALKKVDSSRLTGSQKVFVFFLKKRKYGILRMLVRGRQILKNARGAKLKK